MPVWIPRTNRRHRDRLPPGPWRSSPSAAKNCTHFTGSRAGSVRRWSGGRGTSPRWPWRRHRPSWRCRSPVRGRWEPPQPRLSTPMTVSAGSAAARRGPSTTWSSARRAARTPARRPSSRAQRTAPVSMTAMPDPPVRPDPLQFGSSRCSIPPTRQECEPGVSALSMRVATASEYESLRTTIILYENHGDTLE